MAKITIFGGTGYAGAAIAQQAKSRGHDVTVVSRSPAPNAIDGVTYVTASSAEAESSLAGSDVVIAALSPRGDNAGKLGAVYRDLADKAAKAGARFVAIGGFSSTRPAAGAPRFAEGDDIPPQFAGEVKEMNAILEEFEAGATTADWLFVSPAAEFGSYVPGQALGHYRVSGDLALFDEKGKSAISGADFGLAVIDEVDKPTKHRAQIHFAY